MHVISCWLQITEKEQQLVTARSKEAVEAESMAAKRRDMESTAREYEQEMADQSATLMRVQVLIMAVNVRAPLSFDDMTLHI